MTPSLRLPRAFIVTYARLSAIDAAEAHSDAAIGRTYAVTTLSDARITLTDAVIVLSDAVIVWSDARTAFRSPNATSVMMVRLAGPPARRDPPPSKSNKAPSSRRTAKGNASMVDRALRAR
jgi:hypothetical protein